MNAQPLRLCAIAVLLMLCAVAALAEEKSDKQAEGMALLRRAVELTDISEQRYQLEYSLSASDPVLGRVEGTKLLIHASAQKIREEIRTGRYKEVSVFTDGQLHRVRNLPFTPAAFRGDPYRQLTRLRSELNDFEVAKVFDRKFGDNVARCITQKRKRDAGESTWCVAKETGLPVAHLTGGGKAEFLNYVPLGTRQIPSEIRSSVMNVKAEVRLLKSGTQVPDDALFEHPAGATSQPWCEDMSRPMPTSTPDPEYSEEARRRGLSGTVTYAVNIGADGVVKDTFPVRTHEALDKSARRALQGWRFKPAMCGATPVPTDILVEINFNTR